MERQRNVLQLSSTEVRRIAPFLINSAALGKGLARTRTWTLTCGGRPTRDTVTSYAHGVPMCRVAKFQITNKRQHHTKEAEEDNTAQQKEEEKAAPPSMTHSQREQHHPKEEEEGSTTHKEPQRKRMARKGGSPAAQPTRGEGVKAPASQSWRTRKSSTNKKEGRETSTTEQVKLHTFEELERRTTQSSTSPQKERERTQHHPEEDNTVKQYRRRGSATPQRKKKREQRHPHKRGREQHHPKEGEANNTTPKEGKGKTAPHTTMRNHDSWTNTKTFRKTFYFVDMSFNVSLFFSFVIFPIWEKLKFLAGQGGRGNIPTTEYLNLIFDI